MLLVILSFGADFGVFEYWREKDRPVWSSMAATAGSCAYQDKDIPRALKDHYAALFLDPSNSDAHLGLGSLFYDQGKAWRDRESSVYKRPELSKHR